MSGKPRTYETYPTRVDFLLEAMLRQLGTLGMPFALVKRGPDLKGMLGACLLSVKSLSGKILCCVIRRICLLAKDLNARR